jgi:hypothetical protein
MLTEKSLVIRCVHCISWRRAQNSRAHVFIIVNIAANAFCKVSGLISRVHFRDEEMGTYDDEYNFRNAPALHPEKVDLIAGRSVTWPGELMMEQLTASPVVMTE